VLPVAGIDRFGDLEATGSLGVRGWGRSAR
jgi:hypothetical protein